MVFKTSVSSLLAASMCAGIAFAAVPADTQKAFTDIYAQVCQSAMDPTDKNFDAAAAYLSPDYTETDVKGVTHKRDEVLASAKQQLKMFKATSCDNSFNSITSPDASTIVIVNTEKLAGEIQAPDGKHDFTASNKTQDTWKQVGGKWLQTTSKDLHVLVKVDGNVVQDAGE